MNKEIKQCIQRIKSGEYNGADLMSLWCYAESMTDTSEKLLNACEGLLDYREGTENYNKAERQYLDIKEYWDE
jgi:hypothetical protein